ncbi:MAG: YlxR family protein [Syntrophobacteraceae bacterium]
MANREGEAPIRSCLVCGSKASKYELVRLALDHEGCITLDPSRRMEGRGAYVCPSCLPRLRFNKKVQWAFRNKAKGVAPNICEHSSQKPVKRFQEKR